MQGVCALGSTCELPRFAPWAHSMLYVAPAGILTAAAIFIHNFPEGLAVFSSALADTSIGIGIALVCTSVIAHIACEGGSRFACCTLERVEVQLGPMNVASFASLTTFDCHQQSCPR